MPVSAAGINAYSVSYETLTSAITTDDGSTVPAGAVAVTMSIDNNAGFDSNTMTLEIDDGYTVLTDASGNPIVQKGTALSNGSVASAISTDGDTVCVAAAMNAFCDEDGAMFTVYATTADEETTGFVTVTATDEVTISADENYGIALCSEMRQDDDGKWYMYYYGGDCNNDNEVDATDAAFLRQVLTENGYPEGTTGFSRALLEPNKMFLTFFSSVVSFDQPNADGNDYINWDDSTVILGYAAAAGVKVEYTGDGAGIVGEIHRGPEVTFQ